ncbi:MAG: DMT family transporter [bacterium]|nr:DMT family transporter [bacterium]
MSVHGPKFASTSATAAAPADRGQASRARGVALVAAAGLLWSTFGLGVRLMGDVGPWAILFYRAIPQIIVLVVLITVRHRGATLRTIAGIGLNGLVSGASLTFSSMCFVYALTLTTVAEATLILGAAPVLAGVLGWLILREPITRTNWWTMGLAAAGLGVMTYTGTVSGSLAGTILTFGAALGFAAFTVFQRRGMRTDMLSAVIVSGLLTLLVTGPLVGGVTISGMNILLAIYLGGVALAGGLALFTAGSRHVRSTELVLIAMLEVVFAPVWVWWALGEGMAVATMVGGAIILTAVLIQAREGQARFRRAGPMPPVSAP